MRDFCEEYSPNNSSMKTLPAVRCSLLEYFHLQKFNYIYLIPPISKIFENKRSEIKPESSFRMLTQELLTYMISSFEDFSKILTLHVRAGQGKLGFQQHSLL